MERKKDIWIIRTINAQNRQQQRSLSIWGTCGHVSIDFAPLRDAMPSFQKREICRRNRCCLLQQFYFFFEWTCKQMCVLLLVLFGLGCCSVVCLHFVEFHRKYCFRTIRNFAQFLCTANLLTKMYWLRHIVIQLFHLFCVLLVTRSKLKKKYFSSETRAKFNESISLYAIYLNISALGSLCRFFENAAFIIVYLFKTNKCGSRYTFSIAIKQ